MVCGCGGKPTGVGRRDEELGRSLRTAAADEQVLKRVAVLNGWEQVAYWRTGSRFFLFFLDRPA